MFRWKMYKFTDEAHSRTYQIYFMDHEGTKWYLDNSFYFAEAASMVDLLSDNEVRAAVAEYMEIDPADDPDFIEFHKVFDVVSPALNRICSGHGINWYESSVNVETIKKALKLERMATK